MASESCTEVFPLSVRTAVVRTHFGEEHWERQLRDWWEQDPTQAVLQLRHKRLVHDGAVWAAAPGTGAQQRRLAVGASGVSTRLAFQLHGPSGPRPEQIFQEVGAELGKLTGAAFQCVCPHEALRAYTLRPDVGLVAGAFTGRFEVAVSSPAEAGRVRDALHGRGLQIGPDLLSLEVQLQHAPDRPGNGRRC